MPLYVTRPQDPTAGADWVAAVPGQYLYDITGITATLTTNTGTDLPTDVSGNGNNGVYSPLTGSGRYITGAVGTDLGLNAGGVPSGSPQTGATLPATAVDLTGDFSINWWRLCPPGTPTDFNIAGYTAANAAVFGLTITSGGVVRSSGAVTVGWDARTASGVMPFDSTWHMVTAVYNATTHHAKIYFDGVLQTLASDVAGTVGATALDRIVISMTNLGVRNGRGGHDELSFHPAQLSAPDVAGLFAARTSFAGYTATVLSLNPTAYYHLDGTGAPAGGRQVALEITDGSNVTALVPTGFAEAPIGGPFTYSWQPKLAASAQNAAGTQTTVAIPRLTLPAGYTIGSRTLDIGSADQWSDISIWWDSTLMDLLDLGGAYDWPPGVKLVYVQDPPGTAVAP